jgi:hypothetical protein
MGGRVKGNYKKNGGAFVKQKRKPKVRKKKAKIETKFPPKPAFRRSAKAELQNKNFLFLFEKNRGAQNLKKCRENFLFWTQTSSKFAGGSGRGAKSQNRDFPQKKF